LEEADVAINFWLGRNYVEKFFVAFLTTGESRILVDICVRLGIE
jgi:hypothetical protein